MSLQRARWQPLMPFLYPQRNAQPARSIHFQPTNRNYAKAQKSMAVQRAEAASKQQDIRGDLGLLEGHFVRPTGPRKPSLIWDWKRWRRMQWLWVKSKFYSVITLWSYKFAIRKGKPRPKLDRRKIGPLAQTMYEEMYTAFARGDVETLKGICLEGIQASLRSKIDYRPLGERVHWTLHRYIGRPRIVSTGIARLPLDVSAIYQVVVKIKSMQSLEKIRKGTGAQKDVVLEETKGEPKKVTEYVVLQKRMIKGKEDLWKIWGMTEETKPEDVMQEESVSHPQAMVK